MFDVPMKTMFEVMTSSSKKGWVFISSFLVLQSLFGWNSDFEKIFFPFSRNDYKTGTHVIRKCVRSSTGHYIICHFEVILRSLVAVMIILWPLIIGHHFDKDKKILKKSENVYKQRGIENQTSNKWPWVTSTWKWPLIKHKMIFSYCSYSVRKMLWWRKKYSKILKIFEF